MSESIPLLDESMVGARLAGVVDYLKRSKKTQFFGFVGPVRERGQEHDKNNQAYFTHEDWLGCGPLERGAEVAFTLAYEDGRPQARDLCPVNDVSAVPRPSILPQSQNEGTITLKSLAKRILTLVDEEDGELLAANVGRQYRNKYTCTLDYKALGFERLSEFLKACDGVEVGAGSRGVVTRVGAAAAPAPQDGGQATRRGQTRTTSGAARARRPEPPASAKPRHGDGSKVKREAAPAEALASLTIDIEKLCDAEGSILLANLPKVYQRTYGTKLCASDYSYDKVSQLLQALDGLHVETGPRGFVAREGPDVAPPPQVEREPRGKQGQRLPQLDRDPAGEEELSDFSADILRCIDEAGGEVLAAHLPKRYSDLVGKKLQPSEYGYEKMLELLRATPGVACGSGQKATITRASPRVPAAAEDDTDLANPTIDAVELCDLGAHAPTFTPGTAAAQ